MTASANKSFSFTRRTLLSAAAALPLLHAIPSFAADREDRKNPQNRVKLRLGYWTSGISLGIGSVLEARAEEFFAPLGLDVSFLKFPDSTGPVRAFASGSIDVAFAAPISGVLNSSASGVPLRVIAATQPAEVQFVVPADSPIKSLADLRGKKVAMSPAGSAAAVLAQAILSENYGIGPRDFTLVGGNEGRLVQFLAQHQVDAAALRIVTITQFEKKLNVRRLSSFGEEWTKLTKSSSNALPYLAVTTTTRDLAEKTPEIAARLLAGFQNALDWGLENPIDVAATLQKAANMSADNARIYASLWKSMNRVAFEKTDIDTLNRQREIFEKAGLFKGTPDPALFDTKPYALFKANRAKFRG